MYFQCITLERVDLWYTFLQQFITYLYKYTKQSVCSEVIPHK